MSLEKKEVEDTGRGRFARALGHGKALGFYRKGDGKRLQGLVGEVTC